MKIFLEVLMLDVHAISIFAKLNPSERKEVIKQIENDQEFKSFYEYITKNKLLSNFMCRRASSLLSLKTNDNYLHYFYIMLMSNSYEVNFEPFFKYYNLNKEEKNYITKLFYIDIDYKDRIKPIDVIKNILDSNYSIEDFESYLMMKFDDINTCNLYRKLSNAFNYIKKHPSVFNIKDKNIDKKLLDAFKFQFNEIYMDKIYPEKTSLEPTRGLVVKRYKVSTITSPTRTTGLPLTNTVEEPVIETPSCVSPVTGCVCGSHLSPKQTIDLPLTKTSVEPETDLRGGYGICPSQISPTRTTGLPINKTPYKYKSIYEICKERYKND